ncbi:MAG: transcriptional repressor [Phycisphaerales bacterium]|nr:MAG: transcriptional repressor [Phycisphaerales bacterium]
MIAPPRRKSQQRDLILRELRRLASHPTAADLYQVVRRHLPRISMGTIYRNLAQLAEDGEIRKLETGPGSARFDGNTLPHYHVRCQQCGRVDDLRNVPADVVRDDVGALCGYQILGHRLEFIGLCPACGPRPDGDGNVD